MRTFKLLLSNRVSYLNASRAYDYLSSWQEDMPLTSFTLFHDNKDVFVLNHEKQIVNATSHGQLIFDGTKKILALGMALEETRSAMLEESSKLEALTKPSKTVTEQNLDEWLAS